MDELLCAKPLSGSGPHEGLLYPCGQCLACTINRRRAWTGRILLEGKTAEDQGQEVTYSTLTYRKEDIPLNARGVGPPMRTLRPRDTQLLFKRMRRELGPFRFVLTGEYGDRFERPHYHALIFGPQFGDVSDFIDRDWGVKYGGTVHYPWSVGDKGGEGDEVRRARANYVARYVTKKRHQPDAEWLVEREPEFFRTSRNPGVGISTYLRALHETRGASMMIAETGDVARTVRICGRVYPLARTQREWLRAEMGIPALKHEWLPDKSAKRYPTTLDYAHASQAVQKMHRQNSQRSVAEVF